MSLLGTAIVFVLKEVARPALRAIGTNVGVALGKRAARRLDPEGFAIPEDEEEALVDFEEPEDDEEGLEKDEDIELDDPEDFK